MYSKQILIHALPLPFIRSHSIARIERAFSAIVAAFVVFWESDMHSDDLLYHNIVRIAKQISWLKTICGILTPDATLTARLMKFTGRILMLLSMTKHDIIVRKYLNSSSKDLIGRHRNLKKTTVKDSNLRSICCDVFCFKMNRTCIFQRYCLINKLGENMTQPWITHS